MKLVLDAPLLPEALAAARIFVGSLPDVPAPGFDRIYLHWEASQYNCTSTLYNAMIVLPDGADTLKMQITHDPVGNVKGTAVAMAAHTYHRNTGAFGICIAGLVKATYSDLGAAPPTLHQLEFLCACAAAVAKKYSIQANAPAPGIYYPDALANEHTIMTHAEAALTTPSYDNNGNKFAHYYCYAVTPWRAKAAGNPVPGSESADPECRWDLAEDEASASPPDEDAARSYADILRQRIHAYKSVL